MPVGNTGVQLFEAETNRNTDQYTGATVNGICVMCVLWSVAAVPVLASAVIMLEYIKPTEENSGVQESNSTLA